MTTPDTDTERIRIKVEGFKPFGLTGTYEGKELKFASNALANKVGNNRQYLVEVTDGKVTAILEDYADNEKKEALKKTQLQTAQIAAQLADADGYDVTTTASFMAHASTSKGETVKVATKHLRDARKLIEKGDGQSFVLLIDDSGGSFQAIRLVGQILGEKDGVVRVKLWHFGPGSKY